MQSGGGARTGIENRCSRPTFLPLQQTRELDCPYLSYIFNQGQTLFLAPVCCLGCVCVCLASQALILINVAAAIVLAVGGLEDDLKLGCAALCTCLLNFLNFEMHQGPLQRVRMGILVCYGKDSDFVQAGLPGSSKDSAVPPQY